MSLKVISKRYDRWVSQDVHRTQSSPTLEQWKHVAHDSQILEKLAGIFFTDLAITSPWQNVLDNWGKTYYQSDGNPYYTRNT